mgnify:CR=1 FL=1
MTNFKYILIFLTAVVILIILILSINNCEPTPPEVIVKMDTAYVVTPGIHLNIDSIKATVKVRTRTIIKEIPAYITILDTIYDTVWYRTPSFVAKDSIIFSGDTVWSEFWFPESFFCHEVRTKTDSIREITKTITIKLEATFAQQAKYGVLGAVLGSAGGFIYGFVAGKR